MQTTLRRHEKLIRRTLFALAVVVAAAAVPASAGNVTVNSVNAVQYSYPYFFATVQASDTVPLTNADVHFVINGTTIVQPDKIEAVKLHPQSLYMLWKVYKYATNVVKPGDTITAVVSDVDPKYPDTDNRTGVCLGGPSKRGSADTANCK